MVNTDRHLSEFAYEQADQFDVTICNNLVQELIKDRYNHDPDLRRFVTITKVVLRACRRRRLKEPQLDIFGAAEVPASGRG